MSTKHEFDDDDIIVLDQPALLVAGGQRSDPSDGAKPEEDQIMRANTSIVIKLYEALSKGDTDAVSSILATDALEWWFHGPPRCQHMMHLLTGEYTPKSAAFRFEPRDVTAVGTTCVIAEGWEGAKAYWVHVWTLKDGLITQFREYFNTWLTVRDTTTAKRPITGSVRRGSRTLWQSQPRDLYVRSLPGLLLAI